MALKSTQIHIKNTSILWSNLTIKFWEYYRIASSTIRCRICIGPIIRYLYINSTIVSKLFLHELTFHRNELPEIFWVNFTENYTIHSHNTRQIKNFHLGRKKYNPRPEIYPCAVYCEGPLSFIWGGGTKKVRKKMRKKGRNTFIPVYSWHSHSKPQKQIF